VELGDGVPLPRQYSAATNKDTTITGTMRANPLFGSERVVFQRKIDAGLGLLVSEAPVIPTDVTTPLMSGVEVRIDFTTDFTGNTIIASCIYQVTTVPPAPLRDLIQVPVRFCAIEGSPQAEGKSAGDTIAGSKLLSLLAQANTAIPTSIPPNAAPWANQARIVFRPAFATQGFPVIEDTIPDDSFTESDKLGDLALSGLGGGNLSDEARACLAAWENRYPDQVGIPLVNVRFFWDQPAVLGAVPQADFGLWVKGPSPLTGRRGDDLCGHPRNLLVSDVSSQFVGISDLALYNQPGTGLTADIPYALAHELGHAVLLGHGNGFDDNHGGLEPPNPGPRRFDEYCDPLATDSTSGRPNEDLPTPVVDCESSRSIMFPSSSSCAILQPLQIEQAREVAKLVPGAKFAAGVDPAGAIAHGDRGCAPPCGLPSDIFLAQLEVATTPAAAVTSFSHTTLGGIPDGVTDRYLFFADLDNDSATGCAPADLGFDTSFQGAELVTSADAAPSSGGPGAAPTVWRCQGGSLVEQTDPNIRAQAYTQTALVHDGGPSSVPLLGRVTVAVPDSVRGPAGNIVRVQGLAERVGTTLSDRLPLAPDAGGTINLTPPDLPDCFIDPLIAAPGQAITVTAPDLPSGEAILQFDGRELAAGPSTRFATSVPPTSASDARTTTPTQRGIHTVTVSVGGAAASCWMLVEGNAHTPTTTASVVPDPNAAGWHRGNARIDLKAVPAPDGGAVASITHSESGAQTGGATVAGANASIEVFAEGVTQVSFHATDVNGVNEPAQSLTVRIDKTPPTITCPTSAPTFLLNEAGSQVHATVADGLSGPTTTALMAAADTTTVGEKSASFTATDRAGNESAAGCAYVVVSAIEPERPTGPTPEQPTSPTPEGPTGPTPEQPTRPTPEEPIGPTPEEPTVTPPEERMAGRATAKAGEAAAEAGGASKGANETIAEAGVAIASGS